MGFLSCNNCNSLKFSHAFSFVCVYIDVLDRLCGGITRESNAVTVTRIEGAWLLLILDVGTKWG
jgi:hypothetical protein